jgi:hypothetical protein
VRFLEGAGRRSQHILSGSEGSRRIPQWRGSWWTTMLTMDLLNIELQSKQIMKDFKL